MSQPTTFTKDPDASLDYRFDWSLWLDDGETITDHDIILAGGSQLSVESSTHDDTSVTAFLSGGNAGWTEPVTCRVTTSENRIDDRTVRLRIRER